MCKMLRTAFIIKTCEKEIQNGFNQIKGILSLR